MKQTRSLKVKSWKRKRLQLKTQPSSPTLDEEKQIEAGMCAEGGFFLTVGVHPIPPAPNFSIMEHKSAIKKNKTVPYVLTYFTL